MEKDQTENFISSVQNPRIKEMIKLRDRSFRDETNQFIIEGYHNQKCSISKSLSKRLLENGMPLDIIETMKVKEEPF